MGAVSSYMEALPIWSNLEDDETKLGMFSIVSPCINDMRLSERSRTELFRHAFLVQGIGHALSIGKSADDVFDAFIEIHK